MEDTRPHWASTLPGVCGASEPGPAREEELHDEEQHREGRLAAGPAFAARSREEHQPQRHLQCTELLHDVRAVVGVAVVEAPTGRLPRSRAPAARAVHSRQDGRVQPVDAEVGEDDEQRSAPHQAAAVPRQAAAPAGEVTA